MQKRMILALLAVVCMLPLSAQTNKGNGQSDAQKEFEQWRKEAYKRYDDFRKQALLEYSDFVRQAWKEFGVEPAVPMPVEEEVMPMLAPHADAETASWFSKLIGSFSKRKATPPTASDSKQSPAAKPAVPSAPKPQTKPTEQSKKPEALPVKQVIKAESVIPQPQPLAEVKEETFMANDYMSFVVFGTECRVRIGPNCRFTLKSVKSNDVADAMKEFVNTQYDNLLYDCLQERKRHAFSDWAYYQMLLTLTNKFYGDGTPEAALAMAFLYSQSGYKMRLAHDETHLYMLAATRHFIYGRPYFVLDGDWYFMFDGKSSDKLGICEAAFPKESSLSLQISAEQLLAANPTPQRTITSRRYPEFSFTVSSNKNYMSFYETYPSSCVDQNFMTRWAMYANTPLEKEIREQLYPAMKEKIQGLSKLQAMERMLNWVQTGLEYQFDEEVWGVDRAFFGEETIYYPFCDCEDRSILLSHLVRDLLGLDVVLVYYPGHLAMAVAFDEEVRGDYIPVDGRKFTVCDPTYIGGYVGETMPMVKNQPTTVILLQKS